MVCGQNGKHCNNFLAMSVTLKSIKFSNIEAIIITQKEAGYLLASKGLLNCFRCSIHHSNQKIFNLKVGTKMHVLLIVMPVTIMNCQINLRK